MKGYDQFFFLIGVYFCFCFAIIIGILLGLMAGARILTWREVRKLRKDLKDR